MQKSTVEEIRLRFDGDVERFSNLETGQSATVDAPLVLGLIAEVTAVRHPNATALLDIGCGAGNFSLRILQGRAQPVDVTLLDLSQPMLERAAQRVSAVTSGTVTTLQEDVRNVDLGEGQFDVVIAAAVLHHLRSDAEWRGVFEKIHASLKPGGSFWISDLVRHEQPDVQAVLWKHYGEYLASLRDEAYRDAVFAYIEKEDSPATLGFQLDLLCSVGFQNVEVLHKRLCFAAFGGMRAMSAE